MKSGIKKVFKVGGEEILTQKADFVTPEEFQNGKVAEIASELNSIATEMRAIGFAAPQIGYSKRIMFIGMEFSNPRRPNVKQFPNMFFVNPQITFASENTTEDWEGCASIDKLLAYVSRHIMIKYKAQDLNGNPIEGQLENFSARVFQHELDHLNGELMDAKAIKTKEFNHELDKIISMKP